MTASGVTMKKGDIITIDGSTGQVLAGKVAMREPELAGEFGTLMKWADAARRGTTRRLDFDHIRAKVGEDLPG